jgi:hypothetical protein
MTGVMGIKEIMHISFRQMVIEGTRQDALENLYFKCISR